jgi:hypothetical protein
MTASKAHDALASMVRFNTHINLLMHGSANFPEQSLLQPWFFGTPTEYLSTQVIEGRTMVDGLDLSVLPRHDLLVDFEARDDGLFVGSMADRALMDEDGIRDFNQDLERELTSVIDQLLEVV